MKKSKNRFIVVIWLDVLNRESQTQDFKPYIKEARGNRWHAANRLLKQAVRNLNNSESYAVNSVSFTEF